jgi:hypothetical protein
MIIYNKYPIIIFFPTLFLFFLMMFLPQTYQEIKIVLLFFSLLVGLFFVKAYYSRKFILWFLIYINFYLIWILLGLVNNNPGVFDFFRVHFLWSILFLVLIRYVNSKDIIYYLFKILIITSLIISVYNIYKCLAFINIVPHLFDLNDDFDLGIYSGFTKISTLNINTLCFLLPFLMGMIVSEKSFFKKINVSKFFFIVSLIVCVVLSILSGRKILFLIFIFNFYFLFFYLLFTRRSIFILYKFFVTVTLLSSVFIILISVFNDQTDLDYNKMATLILEELDPSTNNARNQQKISLINGFYENPIFGTGFGVGVKDAVRNEERPWIYELSYHLYLYNTGIIGIVVYSLCLIFPIVWSVYLLKKDYRLYNILLPTIMAYLSVLIANGTNPVIAVSFDFGWMLFLPIGVLNCLEITLSKSSIKMKRFQSEGIA